MKVLVILMVFLILMPSVLAANTECTGNTLTTNITMQKFVNGTYIENRTYSFIETCDYGCEEIKDVCNPAPYEQTIILGAVIFAIFAIGWVIYSKI